MLPDYVICGAQKSGTSTLHEYLSQHPEICTSNTKEVRFFDFDCIYKKGTGWYEKYFEKCDRNKVVGEASPSYMNIPQAPRRMNETIPHSKLIFILRNPVDRAYSNYWHSVRKGRENLSFEKAIKREEKRVKKSSYNSKESSYNIRHFSYLERGKYAKHIKRFFQFYSEEQIKILIFENFKEEPIKHIQDVYRFLGVDDSFTPQKQKKNVGKRPVIPILQKLAHDQNPFRKTFPESRLKKRSKLEKMIGWKFKQYINKINLKPGYPEMDLETRDKLIEYFEPYNSELEDLLNIDINSWKTS